MEQNFKRGILEACVLAVLDKGESYGYLLVKDISQFVEITESTLYPILKRLVANGQLSVDSREHNGRLRKYYNITESGRNRIDELLDEWKEIVKIYQFITEERTKNND